jgi:hypothetical protein
MTCFWDGCIQAIGTDILKNIMRNNHVNSRTFVDFLKNNIVYTPHVLWNNELLTKKQLDENHEHVLNLDVGSIRGGYDCSTFDPFLFLISQLFKIHIIHDYNGHIITYQYNGPDAIAPMTMQVKSDKGHFWCQQKIKLI